MDLRDSEIKSSISNYITGGEDSQKSLSEFKKLTEIYVYNFPRAAYRKDMDTCSEFYIYMLERFESIIKNFPLEENIQFKTWFNYVLRNQFSHFLRYQKKQAVFELSLDDHENESALEVFETEGRDYSFLYDCLQNLTEIERLSLKLFYMPAGLTSDEIISSADVFHLPIREILLIQGNIIKARADETERARQTLLKISYINNILRELKYRLHALRNNMGVDSARLRARITRYEASKTRKIRDLESPDKILFAAFAPLFENMVRAKRRLSLSKKKLKMIIMYNINAQKRRL